jgi:hypothetical protein
MNFFFSGDYYFFSSSLQVVFFQRAGRACFRLLYLIPRRNRKENILDQNKTFHRVLLFPLGIIQLGRTVLLWGCPAPWQNPTVPV